MEGSSRSVTEDKTPPFEDTCWDAAPCNVIQMGDVSEVFTASLIMTISGFFLLVFDGNLVCISHTSMHVHPSLPDKSTGY
jgi:hypothetical protein